MWQDTLTKFNFRKGEFILWFQGDRVRHSGEGTEWQHDQKLAVNIVTHTQEVEQEREPEVEWGYTL